jgi:3-hydroxy-9,10-secoandrosta-1,3,5(10)-triene-9,17-dione monooxygenase
MAAVLRRNFDDMLGEGASSMTLEKRTLYRYQSASVVRRCAELVDALMPLLGGRAVYMSSPVVQPWLDLNAARAHVANDPNNFGPDLFASLVGEPPAFMFL